MSSHEMKLYAGYAGLAGLGAVYGRGLSAEGIEDRVYRLHYNTGQNRTDSFAGVGCASVMHLTKGLSPCVEQGMHLQHFPAIGLHSFLSVRLCARPASKKFAREPRGTAFRIDLQPTASCLGPLHAGGC
jgi:hypothetical protein